MDREEAWDWFGDKSLEIVGQMRRVKLCGSAVGQAGSGK